MSQLQYVSPEAVGISSEAILKFIDRLEKLEHPHSFMLLRHGKTAAEGYFKPYRAETPHLLFSISKSFTSLAIGFAVQEGILSLETSIAEIFPEAIGAETDPRYKAITIRHLLTMSDGHESCPMEYIIKSGDPDWVRAYFRSPLIYEPGEHFAYNSAGSYMLSAALRRITGEELTAYLRPRLFAPLGFGERKWGQCPQGTCAGGWGFRLTTRELAAFGQLLLSEGKWEGKQLIPAEYFKLATSFQIDNSENDLPDWKQGYGFQFWRCRHNAFRADGAFGQYVLVMPEYDAVFAGTSGLRNMQQVLDLVWEILLPAMRPAPLAEAPEKHAELAARLQSLELPFPADNGIRRNIKAEWKLAENTLGAEKLALDCDEKHCRFLMDGNAPLKIEAAFGGWHDTPDSTFAAAAYWNSPEELRIVSTDYATPYRYDFTIRFNGPDVSLERKANLLFWCDEWPPLRSC